MPVRLPLTTIKTSAIQGSNTAAVAVDTPVLANEVTKTDVIAAPRARSIDRLALETWHEVLRHLPDSHDVANAAQGSATLDSSARLFSDTRLTLERAEAVRTLVDEFMSPACTGDRKVHLGMKLARRHARDLGPEAVHALIEGFGPHRSVAVLNLLLRSGISASACRPFIDIVCDRQIGYQVEREVKQRVEQKLLDVLDRLPRPTVDALSAGLLEVRQAAGPGPHESITIALFSRSAHLSWQQQDAVLASACSLMNGLSEESSRALRVRFRAAGPDAELLAALSPERREAWKLLLSDPADLPPADTKS